MAVSSTTEFELLSGFVLGAAFAVSLGCVLGFSVLAWYTYKPPGGHFKDVKWNLVGNLIADFILLACMGSLSVLALEPFAMPGPVGGGSRALSMRLIFVLLLNEANVRYNLNAKDSLRFDLYWGIGTLVVFLGAAGLTIASMFESTCNLRCISELQTSIVGVSGFVLAAANITVLRSLWNHSASVAVRLLASTRLLSGVLAAVFLCLDASTIAQDGRDTTLLRSPADSKSELYYAIQASAIVVYATTSLALFWLSHGGLLVYRALRNSGYTRIYRDGPSEKDPQSWVF